MAELKPTVSLTNCNMETLSRKEMLEWVNKLSNGNYAKIEDLCSGVAYCQIMEQIFPNCVGMKKIKTAAKLEHEYLHNLRLLQSAFTRLKFDKSVPIDRLMKGRFQDNFEFLQWFKKFYDASCLSNGKENIPILATKPKLNVKSLSSPMLNVKDNKTNRKSLSKEPQSQRAVSPSTVRDLQGEMDMLNAHLEDIKIDRDFYLKKLTAVETLLKLSTERGENTNFCDRAFKILYTTQNDIMAEK